MVCSQDIPAGDRPLQHLTRQKGFRFPQTALRAPRAITKADRCQAAPAIKPHKAYTALQTAYLLKKGPPKLGNP